MPELTELERQALDAYLEGEDISLEACVAQIYKNREPRDLMGDDGILQRTLGFNFEGPHSYQAEYVDKRRGKAVKTEFAEFDEELNNYDKAPSDEAALKLLLEVGDLMYQEAVILVRHRDNPHYAEVMSQMQVAFAYVQGELERRGLDIRDAARLTQVKFGIRTWLGMQGYNPNKDKELEYELCSREYRKTAQERQDIGGTESTGVAT